MLRYRRVFGAITEVTKAIYLRETYVMRKMLITLLTILICISLGGMAYADDVEKDKSDAVRYWVSFDEKVTNEHVNMLNSQGIKVRHTFKYGKLANVVSVEISEQAVEGLKRIPHVVDVIKVGGGTGASQTVTDDIEKDKSDTVRYWVSFDEKVTNEHVNTLNSQGIKIRHTFKYGKLASVVSVEISEQAVEGLKRIPHVVDAIKVGGGTSAGQTVTDEYKRILGNMAKSRGYTGGGIKVAIVDSGIDTNHPDLPSVITGYNFINSSGNYEDDLGHGTNVAGCIAAQDNTIGMVGISPDVDLYIAKVLNNSDIYWNDDLASAIEWCTSNGMDIINISLAGTAGSDAYMVANAIDDAYNAGALSFVAAGNNSDNYCMFPASHDTSIAVSALDSSGDVLADYSNYGSDIEFCAPGDVYTTDMTGAWCTCAGTSFACPLAAGVAACIWQENPSMTNVEIQELMQFHARDIGAVGRDNYYGDGIAQTWHEGFENYHYVSEQYIDVPDDWIAAGTTNSWVMKLTGSSTLASDGTYGCAIVVQDHGASGMGRIRLTPVDLTGINKISADLRHIGASMSQGNIYGTCVYISAPNEPMYGVFQDILGDGITSFERHEADIPVEYQVPGATIYVYIYDSLTSIVVDEWAVVDNLRLYYET